MIYIILNIHTYRTYTFIYIVSKRLKLRITNKNIIVFYYSINVKTISKEYK